MLQLPDGTWNVDFSSDALSITTPDKKFTSLPMTWYPEEGGADAALCQGIVSGRTTWIILQCTSDYYDETSLIASALKAITIRSAWAAHDCKTRRASMS